MNTYTIWITVPEGLVDEVIMRKSAELGSVFEKFIPHITIIGSISITCETSLADIESCVEQVCSEFSPFELEFDRIESGQHYFQCVYTRLRDEIALQEIHSRCRQILFDNRRIPFQGPNSNFMPHVSLIYGNLDDVSKALHVSQLQDETYGSPMSVIGKRWNVQSIDIVWTPLVDEQSIQQWSIVKRIPLRFTSET